ncbi:TetR/AcrR family transcriptional regulator [Leuconostocaceae bacterium ESL0723]|nr:TetR/AcrR family transcriptional regulator [Leuconostocaceae bacterium ESL0723]
MANKTAQLMRAHIIETTINIMRTVPFSKLSVKEICQQADINRNTFYRHFHDKYDLLTAVFDVSFQAFFQNIDLEAFKRGPYALLSNFELSHYLTALDFQLKDEEFKAQFNQEIFRQFFQLSDDPDFIWTLGQMFIVNLWNENQVHPLDPMRDADRLDEIIKTKHFPKKG